MAPSEPVSPGHALMDPTPSHPPFPEAPPSRRRVGTPVVLAAVVLLVVAAFGIGVGVGSSRPIDGAAAVPSPGAPAVSPAPSAAPSTPATDPSPPASAGPSPSAPADGDEFALIEQAWQLLHEKYVGRADLDDRELAYGAIRGLTDAVGDTGHTSFQSPEELQASEDALEGEYVGIGTYVDEHDRGLRVAGVIPRSPAARAGLEVGDIILEVDGTSLEDLTIDQAGDLIRGPEGTSLTLEVDPVGPVESETVTLERASIVIPTVEWAIVPGSDIAHVKVLQFSAGATDRLKEALEAARERGARKALLDLRGNPGGYVSEANGVASQFLASGVVYLEEDADGKRTPSEVQPGGVWTDLPVVVLVDASTASSAEIVASALQDAGRATVVGERTFGTGTVLARFDLADGSALRIGTIRWLTPKGRAIWHEGVEPDVSAALPEGVAPLSPEEVGALTPTELGASVDGPLREALTRLGWSPEG